MKLILLVEDKATVRYTIQAVLEDNGYSVHTAEDGKQAMSYLSGADNMPDLIISDIVMPNMTGVEFIQALRDDDYCAPVLLISGGGYDMSAADLLESSSDLADAILQKPFINDDLLGIVRDLLSAETQAA